MKLKRKDYSIRVWTRGRKWNATIKTPNGTTILYARAAVWSDAFEQACAFVWKAVPT